MLREENLLLFRLRLKDSDERDQVPLLGNKHVRHGMGMGEICPIPGVICLSFQTGRSPP